MQDELPFAPGDLASVLDAMHEGLQVIGRDWRYLYLNAAASAHAKRPASELVGRTMMACYPGIDETEMFAVLERCMRDGTSAALENRFEYPDGSVGWFELRIQPAPQGVMVLSIDVSERKQLDAQLRHAQKMEAIGRLAGGIAHDFNNVLTVVLGFAALDADLLPEEHPVRKDLEQIVLAGERAGRLTQRLLAFARQSTVAPKQVDLVALVGDMHEMFRQLLGADVDLAVSLEPVWPTWIDPGALEQVLVNLVVNAREAMPEGGRLALETRNMKLDEAHLSARGIQVPAGDWVMLAVSDTGVGMTPEVRERVFDPFYTTKEHGTGLGLATSLGIVKQAGGYLWPYSEPGRGTTFRVYLPRSRWVDDVAEPTQPPTAAHGDETVLVVEDDELVRRVTVRTLERYGYRTLEAASAEEAIALTDEGARYDAVVTDMIMPRTSGLALTLRLRAHRADLPVVFVSGYTELALKGQLPHSPRSCIVDKPFEPVRLARALRQVLDGTSM